MSFVSESPGAYPASKTNGWGVHSRVPQYLQCQNCGYIPWGVRLLCGQGGNNHGGVGRPGCPNWRSVRWIRGRRKNGKVEDS